MSAFSDANPERVSKLILFGGYALLPAQPFQYDADLLFS